MWLIITTLAALLVTATYLFVSDKHRIGMLALALWGLSACIFVDHVMGYMAEPGEFFEIGAEPLVLSIAMLIPIFAIWELYVLVQKLREEQIMEDKIEDITESA